MGIPLVKTSYFIFQLVSAVAILKEYVELYINIYIIEHIYIYLKGYVECIYTYTHTYIYIYIYIYMYIYMYVIRKTIYVYIYVCNKKNSKSKCSNYGPIFILSNIDRIPEKIMYNKLYTFLE